MEGHNAPADNGTENTTGSLGADIPSLDKGARTWGKELDNKKCIAFNVLCLILLVSCHQWKRQRFKVGEITKC